MIVSGYSDAVTFDEDKAALLEEVFWTFTDIEHETTQYEDIETILIYDDEGNRQEQETIVVKTKLSIQNEKNSFKKPQIPLFLMSKNFIISALSVAKALSDKVFNPYSGRI